MRLNKLTRILRHPLFIPILLVVLLSIPHPFQKYFEVDEGVYAAVADSMVEGNLLYKNIWDHKPPLVYVIYSVVGLLGPINGMFVLRILTILLKILTVFIFYKVLKKINVKGKFLLFLLSIFSLLVTLPIFEGNLINIEIFFLPVIAYFILRILNQKGSFLDGFLLFIAFCLKFQAFAEILFIIFAVIIWEIVIKRKVDLKKYFKTFIGFALPTAIITTIFLATGILTEAFNALIIANFNYVDQTSYFVSLFGVDIPRKFLILFFFILALAITYLKFFSTKNKSTSAFQNFLIVNIILFEIFIVLYPQRTYPHYLIQLLPGFVLSIYLIYKLVKKSRNSIERNFKLLLYAFSIFIVLFVFTERESVLGKSLSMALSPYFYYSSFFQDPNTIQSLYFQNDNLAQNVAGYISANYSDYKNAYLYTSNTWIFTLSNLKYINKYFFYTQMYFSDEMFLEEKQNMLSADVIFLQTDLPIKPSLESEIYNKFIEVEEYKGFKILIKR